MNNLSFNTSIAQMMIMVNELYKHPDRPKKAMLIMAQLLMPFAPHFAEEIWEKMGGAGLVSLAKWPAYDPLLCKDDSIQMAVQVNGKMRGTIQISPEASEQNAVEEAKKVTSVLVAIGGKPISKVIYKAGKILNLIV